MVDVHSVALRMKLRVIHHSFVSVHVAIMLLLLVMALLRGIAIRVGVSAVGVVEVRGGCGGGGRWVHGGSPRPATLLSVARGQRIDELV